MTTEDSNNPDKLLYQALSAAQREMGHAIKNKTNEFLESTYSDLTSVLDAIREPFGKHGLAVCQPIVTDNGTVYVTTLLLHAGGGMIQSSMPLPLTQKPQDVGKTISYWRRYQLLAICGLGSKDDDAQTAQQDINSVEAHLKAQSPTFINAKQVAELEALLATCQCREEFLKVAKIANLKSLLAARYEDAVRWITAKGREVSK